MGCTSAVQLLAFIILVESNEYECGNLIVSGLQVMMGVTYLNSTISVSSMYGVVNRAEVTLITITHCIYFNSAYLGLVSSLLVFARLFVIFQFQNEKRSELLTNLAWGLACCWIGKIILFSNLCKLHLLP